MAHAGAAQHGDRRRLPHRPVVEQLVELVDCGNRAISEGNDHVAAQQSGTTRRPAHHDRLHHHPGLDAQLQVTHHLPGNGDVVPADADVAAPHAAFAHQVHAHVLGRVDGGGEADALRRHDGRRVDAHHLAVGGDQRPAGVAGVERGVGLDHVVHLPPGPGSQRAAHRAHHARGHRVLEPVRVADGDHQLTHADRRRVAERRRHQIVAGDPHHREVGLRVGAYQVRLELPPVRQRGGQRLGVGHHVAVGEDEAVGREDESGGSAVRGIEVDHRRRHRVDRLDHGARVRIEPRVGGAARLHAHAAMIGRRIARAERVQVRFRAVAHHPAAEL